MLVFVTVGLVVYTAVLSDSTKKLVRGAEDTAERQLRAYVHIDLNEFSRFDITPGRILQAGIVLRNSGQTPAYDVVVVSDIECHPYPQFGMGSPIDDDKEGSRAVLNAGQQIYFKPFSKITVSTEDSEQIESGGWRPYIFGSITYRDVFGKKRLSEFRLVSDESGCGNRGLTYCREGNDAD